ncbi:MAG: CcoQ/FixQ family Cbb3-type cytochrome c oxidase assembly chaperone [Steroidobacteraceae bacterium]
MNETLGIINGLVIALLIVLYSGLVLWAWSSRRRAAFDAAAHLPLEEDNGAPPHPSQEQRP